MPSTDIYAYEYYPTPNAYVRWLREYLAFTHDLSLGYGLAPCVGSGVIPQVFSELAWVTNDLDPGWPADVHGDAGEPEMWQVWLDHLRGITAPNYRFDLLAENPAYSCAFPMLWNAIHASAAVTIALHVRLSFFEATKTNPEKVGFLATHAPRAILHLPRYPYQKSRRTGDYSQDTMPSCWAIWEMTDAYDADATKMVYPPAWVYYEAKAEHRARVSAEKIAAHG